MCHSTTNIYIYKRNMILMRNLYMGCFLNLLKCLEKSVSITLHTFKCNTDKQVRRRDMFKMFKSRRLVVKRN